MSQNINLEDALIKRFITKSKRKRYLGFIADPKQRSSFIAEVAHFADLDFSKFDEVSGNDIEGTINQRTGNEKDCYVISENEEIDCMRMPVKHVLAEIIGRGMGTLLVFGDAKFVYCEGEGKNNRWISK